MDRPVTLFLPHRHCWTRPPSLYGGTRLRRLPVLAMRIVLSSIPCLSLCAVADTTPASVKTVSTGKEIGEKSALSASLLAIRAVAEGDATNVDLTLTGSSTPSLEGEGKRIVVVLPRTGLSPDLASNLSSGGTVAGISVETPKPPLQEARVALILKEAGRSTIVPGPDRKTVRVHFVPASAPIDMSATAPLTKRAGKGLYDVDAYQSDVSVLLKSLAKDAGVNIVLTGAVSGKVTVDLQQVTVEQAIDLLAKSAGLAYHKDGDTFVVGAAKDLDAAYPKPMPEPVKPPAPALPVMTREVYHCRHITAGELITTLSGQFDKEALKVSLGPSAFTPRLDAATSSEVTGVQANVINATKTTGTTGGETESSDNAHDIVLYGEKSVVADALALAQKLDSRRAQVRIGVRITDINTAALKELGVRWDWSNFSVHETGSRGINFGAFARDPVSIEATLSALEKNDRAKLLAAPTLSLLDGEKGFILIGQRILYPKLVGYTQAQTPIFDKEEERVGIYLQVAAQTTGDGEVLLTIYPQVSVVTGFLTINGASYPQISTREQQTTVRVKTGQKIVVGGLIRDEEINNVQKVPILSKIPFFGELFTYRKKNREQSEVVIIIEPEILKD